MDTNSRFRCTVPSIQDIANETTGQEANEASLS